MLSGEIDRQNHTARTNAYDNYFGFLPGGVGAYNPIEGDPAVSRKLVGFNGSYSVDDSTELYGFGTYGDRSAAAYQNIRSPIIIEDDLRATQPAERVPERLRAHGESESRLRSFEHAAA